MLFSLGHVVATAGALEHLISHGICPQLLIARHSVGDWGNLSRGDKVMNGIAIHEGTRILSAYDVCHVKMYVITEADRSYTTLLLASEY
jgi:hypothetical protein